MRKVIPLSIVLLFLLASLSFGQTATRAEFQEYCNVIEGRWIGEVTWITDWPGYGKKGDKVTAYAENQIVADGNAISGPFYAGNGKGTRLIVFDTGAKQIKCIAVSSGGTVHNQVFYKQAGKWQILSTGSLPDGSTIEGKYTITISDNGKTHTYTGSTTIGGEKVDERHDVWRRVSK